MRGKPLSLRIAPLLLLVAALLGLAPAVVAQSGPVFEAAPCPVDAPDYVDCGVLYVPEDRSDPNSPEIALAVAIVRAAGEAVPDPIIYLEGGPGGSALTGLDAWLDTIYNENRDVILIDQRGTGYSEPGLFCDTSGMDVNDEMTDVAACRDALEAQGIDLGDYNSANNAADIADLRVALGYDEVNLYGISYGTRLAMTVMRDHPQGIRSVVLDSPFPPAADAFNEDGVNFYYALTTLAADCAADAACNAAFPDIEGIFIDLVERTYDEPIMLGGTETFGGDLIEMTYNLFYQTDAIPYLPAIFYDALDGRTDTLDLLEAQFDEGGDFTRQQQDDEEDEPVDFDAMTDAEFNAFLMDALGYDSVDALYDYLDSLTDAEYFALLDELAGLDDAGDFTGEDDFTEDSDFAEGDFDRSDAQGMFNSVTCAEEIPFSSPDGQAALMAGLPEVLIDHFAGSLASSFEICDVWGVPLSGPVEDAIVVSDIPTLILVGQYDVATPPMWADLAAEGLSNALVLEFPGAGHGIIDATPCAREIGADFINDPTGTPDTTCLTQIGPPEFYIP